MKSRLVIKHSDEQCPKEEFINTITHGIGLALSIFGSAFLLIYSYFYGKSEHFFASSVFCFVMIFLYGSSTFYHHTKCKKRKNLLKIIDHSAIYLMIAGSYTLVLLTLMQGTLAYIILGVQWTIALIGIYLKFKNGATSGFFSSAGYVAMGWMIILIFDDFLKIPSGAFNLILLEGAFYTLGVVFFVLDHKYKYFHAIWHGLVIGGTAMHFLVGALYIV